jgi:hypothetical protein
VPAGSLPRISLNFLRYLRQRLLPSSPPTIMGLIECGLSGKSSEAKLGIKIWCLRPLCATTTGKLYVHVQDARRRRHSAKDTQNTRAYNNDLAGAGYDFNLSLRKVGLDRFLTAGETHNRTCHRLESRVSRGQQIGYDFDLSLRDSGGPDRFPTAGETRSRNWHCLLYCTVLPRLDACTCSSLLCATCCL